LTLVVVGHLLMITPTVYRASRHALVLYPLAAVFAAVALQFAEDRLPSAFSQAAAKVRLKKPAPSLVSSAAGAIVFFVFVLVCLPKVAQTTSYVLGMHSFKPSQARMAEFIRATLERDAKVGLLEIVPFTWADRRRSRADFVEVSLGVTEDELRDQGIEYVIGTGRIGPEFGNAEDTLWDTLDDKAPVAEFGQSDLASRAWPVGDIYLYLVRVPGLGPEVSP
jgi:hypothetical protein